LPFHPLIGKWFSETYGEPTAVQREAWPLIAEGRHVLAIAPTGSGKTLTGFLSALSRFADGTYQADELSVLYISPLKALNEDIKRNLILPLEGIRRYFENAGKVFPNVRVETRSGDTTQTERRRFLVHPPSILALTPESLAILLLNSRARDHLSCVKCLILDEIHASLGNRRGAFLSCQVDHLSLVAGEFQRVALSATVNPPQAAADFAGGLMDNGRGGHEKRAVSIVAPPIEKKILFKVEFPETTPPEIRQKKEREKAEAGENLDDFGERYDVFIDYAISRIHKNRSTLIYTDSRRRAERTCYLINQTAGELLAFTHHGSLSKDLRRAAEKALAEGKIPCVVATSSLELGIDIGNVDEVILAGSPFSASSALQRVGRSGHGVGQESRGILFPFHGLDLLAAASVAGAVEDRELETSESLDNPLDVLAQTVLALCTEKERYEDDLFAIIQGFYVFRNLPREAFNGVVRMLSGGYGEKRMRELPRRLFRDSQTGLLTAASGTLGQLYCSGGVIANRGYFSLRLAAGTDDAGAKMGELDEEFVWERRVGDCFNFGGRSWRVSAIGSEAVEVYPLSKDAGFTPFWKADTLNRGKVISRRMLEIMDNFNRDGENSLSGIRDFSPEAVVTLGSFLWAQSTFQSSGPVKVPLPGPFCIPVEIIDDPSGGADARLVVIHSFRGSGINYPLSMCLMGDLEEHWGIRVETTVDNNAVMLRIPRSLPLAADKIIRESFDRLGQGKNIDKRLGDVLASSGVFNAAFRESAEASLLLPRAPFGRRVPLWITRQKSKRLFDSVVEFKDFPVVTEALRTCLQERFDMEDFRVLIDDLREGTVSLPFFYCRRPSPFARQLVWLETGALLYEYDERKDLRRGFSASAVTGAASLSDLAIAEALIPGSQRPALDPELSSDFCSRLRREKEGWAPDEALAFCEWIKERVAVPTDNKNEEWERLLEYLPQQLKDEIKTDPTFGGKIAVYRRPGAGTDIVVHRDWQTSLEGKTEKLLENALPQWFRSEGPVSLSRLKNIFGFSAEEAERSVSFLIETEELIPGVYIGDNGEELFCDKENLELLLRLSRKKRREGIKERPGRLLFPFLAKRQGLLNRTVKSRDPVAWESLAGFTAPVKLWEAEFFPSRCEDYRGEFLDMEIREGRLVWYGAGKEKTGFCTPEDLDLALPLPDNAGGMETKTEKSSARGTLVPDFLPANFFDIPRSFWQIKEAIDGSGLLKHTDDEKTGGPVFISSAEISLAIWKSVWQGTLSADSWEPVRRAAALGFITEAGQETASGEAELTPPLTVNPFGRSGMRIPRSLRERWKGGPPVQGNWFSLAADYADFAPDKKNSADSSWEESGENPWGTDPLAEDELNRARVRLLLRRFGFLCRPLLEHEVPVFSWSKLLPSMRRMELAGELVAGRFFSGINSLQFAPPGIVRDLEEAENEQGIYWMNAADPASPCGVPDLVSLFENGKIKLPSRLPSSRICFRVSEIIAVSARNGKELKIDPELEKKVPPELMNFICFPRHRSVYPERKIEIEKINNVSAASSGFADKLKDQGFVNDRSRLVLW
ncbi:MAG: DEAD/DEAH box helicase, partial [Treponema sp.]|nr:DEAD/DEAH box helicase [Treponema sp.]